MAGGRQRRLGACQTEELLAIAPVGYGTEGAMEEGCPRFLVY